MTRCETTYRAGLQGARAPLGYHGMHMDNNRPI